MIKYQRSHSANKIAVSVLAQNIENMSKILCTFILPDMYSLIKLTIKKT